ncbi:MAG: hypothetical protein AAB948_01890 [Patescibacteria group bacterium]
MIKNKLVKFLASVGLAFSILAMPIMTLAALPKVDFSVDVFDSTKRDLISKVKPEAGDEIIFRITINSSATTDFSNVKIKVGLDSAYMTYVSPEYINGFAIGDVKAKSQLRMYNAITILKKIGDFKATITVSADNAQPSTQTFSLNLSGSSQPQSPADSNDGGSCVIDGFNTSDTKLCNPLPDKNLGELVKRLINYILIGISSMAIVTVVIAAFIIVSSQGNEETIKGAKTSISWAVVGIVLALLAYSIASIIESAVTR